MNPFIHRRWVKPIGSLVAILILLSMGGGGCGKKEPSKQGAQEFKKEVKEIFQKLSPFLLEPASKGDRKTAESALEKFDSDHFQKSRVRPSGLGVLDKDGMFLARWSPNGSSDLIVNFAEYQAFKRALKNGITTQERLFYQGGGSGHFNHLCATPSGETERGSCGACLFPI